MRVKKGMLIGIAMLVGMVSCGVKTSPVSSVIEHSPKIPLRPLEIEIIPELDADELEQDEE